MLQELVEWLEAEDPVFEQRTTREAEAAILESYQVNETLERVREIDEQLEALKEQREQLLREAAATVLGKSLDTLTDDDLRTPHRYGSSSRDEPFRGLSTPATELLTKRIQALANRNRTSSELGRKLQRIDVLKRKIVNDIMGCANHSNLDTRWKRFEEEIEELKDDVYPESERQHRRVRCNPEREQTTEE